MICERGSLCHSGIEVWPLEVEPIAGGWGVRAAAGLNEGKGNRT